MRTFRYHDGTTRTVPDRDEAAARRRCVADIGPLIVRGHYGPCFGWGHVAQRLALGLAEAGVDVTFEPTWKDEWWEESALALKSLEGVPRADARVLHIGPPVDQTVPPGSVWFTMWEVDGLPPGAADRLNTARMVVVPTEFNRQAFRRAGVAARIELCPLGIDAKDWSETGRQARPELVFGTAGRIAHGGARKGLDEVIQAFVAAFPDPDAAGVRLEVKCWPDCRTDQNHLRAAGITYRREYVSQGALADWYRGVDVFVSASRGEGWGLQVQQAMACGAAAAVVPWGGVLGYWNPRCGWGVPYSLARAEIGAYADGWWAVPDVHLLAALMREIATSRGVIDNKKRASAARAKQFTWDQSIGRLISLLAERRSWGERVTQAKSMMRLDGLALAAGCGEKFPDGERQGCGCRIRCLRGRSVRDNGGVTVADCWACPERPPF